jgi:hypothetical protein
MGVCASCESETAAAMRMAAEEFQREEAEEHSIAGSKLIVLKV